MNAVQTFLENYLNESLDLDWTSSYKSITILIRFREHFKLISLDPGSLRTEKPNNVLNI